MNKFHRQTAYAAAFMAAFLMVAVVATVAYGMMIRPADAQEPNAATKADNLVCNSLESQVALVRQFEVVTLSGKDVPAFIALTPVPHLKADELLIVFLGDIARIGVFSGGCMVGYLDPPADAVRAILKQVQGTPV